MKNNELINSIDITPSTTIYKIFQNLTYNFESAIAEFLDNSTQSFKNGIELYKDIPGYIPQIRVIYYEGCGTTNNLQEKPMLQVLDNCFGISNDKLDRVLKLNIRPHNTSKSRNEFGMGLKAAAFWFGSDLLINSKFIEEKCTSILKMSLFNLKEKEIFLEYKDENYFKRYNFNFGTIVEIRNLHSDKKISDARLKRLYRIFSSKYRQDITDCGLQIFLIKVNKNKELFFVKDDGIDKINTIDEALPIAFVPPKFKVDKKTNEEIKVNINDSFIFDGEKYEVTGTIGILDTGSRNIAGLTLFRYGRSIIGDEDGSKYKPYKIFKNPATFEFQRIYGYLNLDDFPVYQAKNGFKWDNGLEDALVDFIYEKITNGNFNLIRLAKTMRSRSSSLDLKNINCEETAKEIAETVSHDFSFKDFKIQYKDNEETFKVQIIDKADMQIILNLHILKNNDINSWIEINPTRKNNEFDVMLNIETPFFDPFNNDETNVKDQLIRFCIYFSYAEIKHREICHNSSHQRNLLNNILSKSDCPDLEIKKVGDNNE